MIETCWSDFKCFSVKFYVSDLVGVIIKVIIQNARCNNKDWRDSIKPYGRRKKSVELYATR